MKPGDIVSFYAVSTESFELRLKDSLESDRVVIFKEGSH